MFGKGRARGRKKNEIIDRDRKEENNTRMLWSEMVRKKFESHGDGPETRKRISTRPKNLIVHHGLGRRSEK